MLIHKLSVLSFCRGDRRVTAHLFGSLELFAKFAFAKRGAQNASPKRRTAPLLPSCSTRGVGLGRVGFWVGSCLFVLVLFASGCGSGGESSEVSDDLGGEYNDLVSVGEGPAVRMLTHSSFQISEEVLELLEYETGVALEIVEAADTGSLVSQIILSKDNPVADVVFGVDNTFLQRVLDEGVFEAYESPQLANVLPELRSDLGGAATPITYGDVCLNYWKDDFGDDSPTSIDDLLDEKYRGQFVTQNPETSSPGLAFMLATIARYGEDGWEDFWQGLRDNDVAVTSSWSEAYNNEFKAGGGDKPIVTSYASSPVAEVFYAEPQPEEAPTSIIEDSCFRQVEYAGILAGTDKLEASQKVIDYMLLDAFQEDIPLNMFVFPTTQTADLPELFEEHAVIPENPLSLPPARIAEMRNEWTDRWVEIVLR